MRRTASELRLSSLGEVGERLRAARAKIGMTRRQLAAASETSERYLANIRRAGSADSTAGRMPAATVEGGSGFYFTGRRL